jgi:NhaA family Na+:H+ antiporter
MPRREALANIAVVATTVCTVVVTGIVVKREFAPGPDARFEPVEIAAKDWEAISNGGLRFGPPEAALTVVEFVDFECPGCAGFARTMKQFRQQNPDHVALVLQHLPLATHPNSRRLAKAVECADHAGTSERLIDSIFTRQMEVVAWSPGQLALLSGVLDTVAFAHCTTDSTRTRRVEGGIELADRLGIRATPTVVANGMRFRRIADTVALNRLLKEALRRRN